MVEERYNINDYAVESLKIPPHSIPAEQSVLGGLLLDNEAWNAVADKLVETDFYRKDHQLIFRAITRLAQKQEPYDVITLSDALKTAGESNAMGWLVYLGMLARDTPSAANIVAYANIVRDRSVLRQLVHVGTEISDSAFAPQGRETQDLLENAERKVLSISEQIQREGGFQSIKTLLAHAVDKIESLFEQEGHITGAATGFTDFDEKTSGLQPADLIIIAGRPSMGKTTVSMNIAENIAIKGDKPVAVFSMEMPGDSLAMRMMSSLGRIDQLKVRTGKLEDDEWPRLTSAINILAGTKLFIDDTPALTPIELSSRARRLAREHGQLGLIVVDYLQLMQSPSSGDNRVQQVSDISRGLKALAKELHVPVIALSQLNRNLEQRPNKRPVMSDLRESGCLVGDSLVTCAKTGQRYPIKDLVGQTDFTVWALNEQTMKLEAAPISNAFTTGRKPVFRLTTQLGRTIRATANHKFYSDQGWQRLDELRVGQYLALPRLLPDPILQKTKTMLSHSECALLGHLIGDGCTLPRHAIQYTTRELDLAELVVQLAKEVFADAVEPRIKQERTWYQVYLTSTRQHTHGVRSAVSEWLTKLGVFALRSHEKHVPAALFEQSGDNIATFLQHLWVTDGSIKLNKNRPRIYYASSSQQLCTGVQSLLLCLGINARLKRVSQGAKGRDQFHVILSGQADVLAFANKIGTVGAYKSQSLAEIISHCDTQTANTNRDIIPNDLWVLPVKSAMQALQMSHRELHQKINTAYAGMTIFKQNLSRERGLRIAKATNCQWLNDLTNSDIYWDKIVSIDLDGEEDVFDLTVPKLHNFIANDIITHNSIEQDADLIVFVYRDEVYNEDSPDKGIAELIIGKQRNGPLGTVRLTFLGQFTRFENFAGNSYSNEDYE